MKKQKLKTTIKFEFQTQDVMPEFNVDMDLKTKTKPKDIKIIEHKKPIIDVSTKLF